MVKFSELTRAEREWLAGSRYGDLPAREIPADWRERLKRELVKNGAIEQPGAEEEEETRG